MNYFSFLLLIGLILTTAEVLLPSNFFISSLGVSFIIGAFFSLIINNMAIVLIFISFTSLSIFFLMKKLKIFGFSPQFDTSRDAYIGKKIFIQKILDDNKGLVKIYSEFWVCKSKEKIEENILYIIVDIKGNTLIIEKKGEKNEY